ncbi:MAG: Tfp pilus assembly protein PilV [Oceanicoccus sp.]|jgi:Tfp pilus assembly protein PilV
MKKNKAFTLLEVLLSITFITVVFTAITGLILVTLQVNRKNIRTLQASYLAQEGVEAMRYIRDSNWLQNYAWDEGAKQWGTNFGLESGEILNEFYLIEEGENQAYWSLATVASRTEDSGIVALENGQEFLRLIQVEPIEDNEDAVKVTALVSWEDRGGDYEVELSTILTNWQ